MKLSWQWLQEFVDLPKVEATTVGEKLTLHTAELEEIIERRSAFERVILGKLLSIAPHPESDKLSVAQFNLGKAGQKQIIFGQVHQVAIGEILPVATDGAQLASGIDIKVSEIRGQKSEGMIADNLELGLKQEGLLRFTDEKLIGQSLPDVISALGDTLFDIDNKSLTHRPDLVGHRGFARELSAIFDAKLTLPEPVLALPQKDGGLVVDIQTKGCRRFCGLRVDNVTVEDSPLEVQMRLENLDIRAISNLVDITNWIMMEYGQPMHVFDADKIEGKIIVRQAKAGETLVALDGETYELSPEDMVVADEQKALSVAGIMGGLDSSVTTDTKNVVFEVANWDPVQIRKTSQRLGLRSDSSMRYEKSLDPEKCRKALMAATERALGLCPKATVSSALVDQYPSPFAPKNLTLSLERLRSHTGLDIEAKAATKILKHLGFGVNFVNENFEIKVPSWRNTKDVSIAEDIIEEVVRIYGLDRVPTILPSFSVEPPAPNYTRRLQWQCRQALAALGYLETYLHSFLVASRAEKTDTTDYVEISNPLSEEYRFLRRDLWPQMMDKLESELRQHRQVQFFELGKVYHPQKKEVLPTEIERLLILRASLETKENDDFFVLKRDLETLLRQLGLNYRFDPKSSVPDHLHPSKALTLVIEEQVIGSLGVLHPQQLPTKGASVVVAELNLAPLLVAQRAHEPKHQAPSTFPVVHRDAAFIVPERVYAAEMIAEARAASPLLHHINLFDEYKDDHKIGVGLKNLAFHLSFRAPDRTLTEEEIELEFGRVVIALEASHQAKLRLSFDNVS